MKNIWKWVVGILLVLVVAAGLFGLGFIHSTMRNARMITIDRPQSSVPNPQTWRGPIPGRRFPGTSGDRMMFPERGPMMAMRGFDRGHGFFMPGLMFFGMFGRLIPLALLLLVVYGAYRLGKGRSAPGVVPVAPAPPAAAPAPASHPCPACANDVLDGWKHCPNCGEKQE